MLLLADRIVGDRFSRRVGREYDGVRSGFWEV